MPVYQEEEVIGMGIPSALRAGRQRVRDEEKDKRTSEVRNVGSTSSSASTTVSTGIGSSVGAEASVFEASRLLDDARGEDDPEIAEKTPSDTVNEPTFKVTLKAGTDAKPSTTPNPHSPNTKNTNVATITRTDGKANTKARMTNEEDVTADFFGNERKIKELGGFSFEHLNNAKYCGFGSKEVNSAFQKWGIKYHISKFRFHEPYDSVMADSFISQLFNSRVFQQHACRTGEDNGHVAPDVPIQGSVKGICFEALKANVMSMCFFDRLADSGITVGKDAKIRGCFEDNIDGMACNSLLRKALVDEDDDNYELFNDEDREEVIFRLFRHLVFGGGGMCQYEDYLKPYLDVCKLLYKDLISVCKNKKTGKLEILSHVYQIKEMKGLKLFPEDHILNTAFVSVDKLRKYVTFYYAAWPGSSW